MTPLAYYNENDPKAAAWLRELIKVGAIAPGDVDERSITDVSAGDLRWYRQCHFFSGIGTWSYALRLAGWEDERECWSGSAPCQPFSSAGHGSAFGDSRHLWPAWFRLIRECHPATIFGEQVEAAVGWGWWDAVSVDLEGEAYAVGAAVLGACCVGAPHIRKRLYWVADAQRAERRRGRSRKPESGWPYGESSRPGSPGWVAAPGWDQGAGDAGGRGDLDRLEHAAGGGCGVGGDEAWPQRGGYADGAKQPCGLADAQRGSAERWGFNMGSTASNAEGAAQERERIWDEPGDGGAIGGVGHPGEPGLEGLAWNGADGDEPGRDGAESDGPVAASGVLNGYWRDVAWIECRDGKLRPIQRATEPEPVALADGSAADLGRMRHRGVEVYSPLIEKGEARTMRLRGYGNAIVAQCAAEFIGACIGETG